MSDEVSGSRVPAPAAPPIGVPDPAAVMARASGENFPVASRLLPASQRAHLLALYGFARLVDQIGDDLPGDRLEALRWLEGELDRAYAGTATYPLMVELSRTIVACDLPRAPFAALIEANRTDQRVREYATFEQLLGYCELSANPVGELVLHIFDLATPARVALSDSVCTALQLTEHWQDVAEDAARGRIYLPAHDARNCGVTREDLTAGTTSPALRLLLAIEVGRTRALMDDGARLIGTLRGRPRLAVAAFVAGGRAALDAIEAADFDVLGGKPRPGRVDTTRTLLATLAGGWR